MRTKIYKYELEDATRNGIRGVVNRVIHVGLDPNGAACLWAEVAPDIVPYGGSPLKVVIVGTGMDVPEGHLSHCGSFVDGVFVWHVYVGQD